MKKIEVGILGATGTVGQKILQRLISHPWFQVTELMASEGSAGKAYGQVVQWRESSSLPTQLNNIIVKAVTDRATTKILFSGLPSSIAGEVESFHAEQGHIVISNSSSHRLDALVPLVIPEVNSDHFRLINQQRNARGGFIITNPNCVVIIIAIALWPIFKRFGLEKLMIHTMQAISGAGYPGIPAMDILGNLIPTIQDEEEKIVTELPKLLGQYTPTGIVPAAFQLSASCNRVPIYDGHTINLAFATVEKTSAAQILKTIQQLQGVALPSSPTDLIKYFPAAGRPQPLLDVNLGQGMTVALGNLRQCGVLDWKFTALGHNVVRGAAGTAILNAEYLVSNRLHL